jgi:hypothetical protein
MRTLFMTIAASLVATTAMSADLSGKAKVDFSEKSNGDIGAKTSVELDVSKIGLGGIDLGFDALDGGDLKLNDWNLSTYAMGVGIEVGDDHNLIPEADGDTNTLTTTLQKEAVKLSYGDVSVVAQFDDWENDISDLDTVQGAYTTEVEGVNVTSSFDYNLDTENTILGTEVDGIEFGELNLGGALTYDIDNEKWAYEGRAGANGITAYVNGDKDDSLQNIGGEYTYSLGDGVDLAAGANYDLDNEDLAPTASITFKF